MKSYLLVGHKAEVDRPWELLPLGLQRPDRLDVLHTYALHVLRAPSVDEAVLLDGAPRVDLDGWNSCSSESDLA